MDLNRETAIRLWNKSFGKKTRVIDYSGREIVKGAYNDRSSEFGWNVDHILPQSKGGKTVDYNLIVCHILTNDEKADRFPVFKANGSRFEIIKVENHYEIRTVNSESEKKQHTPEHDDTVNFLDSASGIRFFKRLKTVQDQMRFAGTVLIRIGNLTNNAVFDFVEKLFDEESISYTMFQNHWDHDIAIVALNYNMPLQEDTSKLLDKCIVLNTYFKYYFVPKGYVDKYAIVYRVTPFEEKKEMYSGIRNIKFSYMPSQLENALYIDSMVYGNTDVKDKVPDVSFSYPYRQFLKYDFTFSKLARNLVKEASKD